MFTTTVFATMDTATGAVFTELTPRPRIPPLDLSHQDECMSPEFELVVDKCTACIYVVAVKKGIPTNLSSVLASGLAGALSRYQQYLSGFPEVLKLSSFLFCCGTIMLAN